METKLTLAATYSAKDGDYVLLPYFDGKKAAFDWKAPQGVCLAAAKKEGGKKLIHAGTCGKLKFIAVASVRVDGKDSDPCRDMRMAVSAALSKAKELECKRLVVLLAAGNDELALAAQEGAVLGGYKFDKYLKEKGKSLPVTLCCKASAGLKKKLSAAETVFKYVNYARDILNEPANVIHPKSLSAQMKKTAAGTGLKLEIWNEARLKKEKCGGILAVGNGASSRPCMAVGSYSPRGAKFHLALVGKGVTFDTGGYCLKPGSSQVEMKMDMGGAAMMFGAACAIAKLKLPIKVTLFTPIVENDISSTAFHTQDILKMRNGLTVEVDNTDAEGRLILADALCLACEKKPDLVIDSATLTGACVVALGEDIAGMYGTDSVFNGQLLDAAEETGEYMWEMPLHLPYREQLKANIADSKNIGGRWGGSITAALFLKQFVKEDQPWIHVDIAGPAIKEAPQEHLGKGAKGFGVKSIVALAKMLG